MEKNTTNKLIILIGIFLFFYLIGARTNMNEEPTQLELDKGSDLSLDWQKEYFLLAKSNLDSYNNDISNTDYYDYYNPIINDVAVNIVASSENAEEAVYSTLDYVYKNINYIYGEHDNKCLKGTAPTVLMSSTGQCDTQSMVVLSILRRMGLAAKPVGGCVISNQKCSYQSIYLNSLQSLGLAPKFNELTDEDLEKDVFSRGDILSRKGGLHAWVIVWLPEKGWLHIESTTGKVADINCYYYHVELFPEDNNKEEFCVSKNYNYAKACQLNELSILNKEGLGLAQEVQP